MKRFVITTALLSLCATGFAQTTQTTTSPPGFENTFGNMYAYYHPFRYPDGRVMVADGNFKGLGAKTIKQIAYRHDNWRIYSTSVGQGRSWTSVTLKMSDTDYSTLSSTFSANIIGSQTTVFNGTLSLPTMTSVTTGPNGGLQPFTAVKVPFSGTGWAYTGTNDMLFDWELAGGTLANNGTFSTSGLNYYLDAATTYSYGYCTSSIIWYTGNGMNCRDSAITSSYSYTMPSVYCYNSDYTTTTSWVDQFRFYCYSYRTASGAPLIQCLSIGKRLSSAIQLLGEPPCEWLFLDLVNNPYVLIPNVASVSTTSPYARFPATDYVLVPYNTAYVGTELAMQSIWDDSVSKNARLTLVGNTHIPSRPALAVNRGKNKTAVDYTPPFDTGTFQVYYYYNPVPEYTYQ